MPNTSDYLAEADQFSAHNYHPLPVVLEKGEGVWVWDVDGNKYLDCLAAYSAVNQGHRHPRIVEAAKRQLDKLTLTSRAFHNDMMGPFLRQLCELTGYTKALPMNTGAEAVETAIKAARRWGYRVKGIPQDKAEIIVHTTVVAIHPNATRAEIAAGSKTGGAITASMSLVNASTGDVMVRSVDTKSSDNIWAFNQVSNDDPAVNLIFRSWGNSMRRGILHLQGRSSDPLAQPIKLKEQQ